MSEYDDEFEEMNKNIRRGSIRLDKHLEAVYVGSSPSLKNVIHIANIVNADVYILSDLLFKTEKTFYFDDCIVKITPRPGFDLPPKNIGFLMIDQGVDIVKDNFPKFLSKLKKGTYVYDWCIEEEDLKEYFEKLKLKPIKNGLYIKK